MSYIIVTRDAVEKINEIFVAGTVFFNLGSDVKCVVCAVVVCAVLLAWT